MAPRKATPKPTPATGQEATPAPKAPKTRPVGPCQCGTKPNGTAKDGTPLFGPCDGTTKGTYQQGHDARAKGMLLRLARAGQEYRLAGQPAADPTILLLARGWIADANEAAKPVRAKKAPKRKHELGADELAALANAAV